MASFSLWCLFLMITILSPPLLVLQTTNAAPFKCTTPGTCNAIIDYHSPNTTALSAVSALFGLKNHLPLLGPNNLPMSTPSTYRHPANRTIKIPLQCLCANGTGTSYNGPNYTVVKDDGLFHIAKDIFAGLVLFPEIQAANGIDDPNKILPGQVLRIPLPCSCDQVDGEQVLHYGHLVASGSTVAGIAQEFGTNEQTLLRLNDLASPKDLMADSILDVPLKACSSSVRNDSLDYPFLVANGTYGFTAGNCVSCNCSAANNFTLRCVQYRQPVIRASSLWPTCPSRACEVGGGELLIGNMTTSSSACNGTATCAYAGYTSKTILSTLASESVCPQSQPAPPGSTTTAPPGSTTTAPPRNSAIKMGLQGWRWSLLFLAVHLVMVALQILH